MAKTPAFKYAPMFQLGKDETEYYLLTRDGVSVSQFEGKEIVKTIHVPNKLVNLILKPKA